MLNISVIYKEKTFTKNPRSLLKKIAKKPVSRQVELRGESAAGFPQSRNWEKLALFFNSLTGDATRKLTVFSLFKKENE